MEVREFVWEDFDTVLEFHKEFCKNFYGLENFQPEKIRTIYQKALAQNPGGVFLAEENGEIIGLLLSDIEYCKWNGNKQLYIIYIHVKQEFRQKGIGKKLLDHAAEHALKIGAKELFLNVDVRNELAHTFYKSCGLTDFKISMKKSFGDYLNKT